MRVHEDERRRFFGDIFKNPDGDTNLVYFREPYKPIAWHRHQHQDDRLFVVSGVLRVRYFEHDRRETVEHILTAKRPDVLLIPRNFWHGYEALDEDTIVLQFNGPGKWDGSDEERRSIEEIPWHWRP